MRWPGIEPGSNAWKASMLTITPPTLDKPDYICCLILNLVLLINLLKGINFYTLFYHGVTSRDRKLLMIFLRRERISTVNLSVSFRK